MSGLVSLGLLLRPVVPALDKPALGNAPVEWEQHAPSGVCALRIAALAKPAVDAGPAVVAAPSLGTTTDHLHPLRREILPHAAVQLVEFRVDFLL